MSRAPRPWSSTATTSTTTLAPVSARTRMWPTVIRVNTSSAITLPIEAIALEVEEHGEQRRGDRRADEPDGGASAEREPITGGNCRVAAISSHRPVAGNSPALVAPEVANSAVTVIIQ